jgi:hypothetical protein
MITMLVALALGSGSAMPDPYTLPATHPMVMPADPTAATQTLADGGWDVVTTYGPLWGAALLAFGLASAFLKRNSDAHWVSQGRRLAVISASVMVMGAVLQWHFNGGQLAGLLVTVVMAVKLVITPGVTTA